MLSSYDSQVELSREQRRTDVDRAETFERAASDARKVEQRALADRTDRTRGDVQNPFDAREHLRSERTREDEALHVERNRADLARRAERILSESALAREKSERSTDAADALERQGAAKERRAEELRVVLGLAETQLRIAENLALDLENLPPSGQLTDVARKLRSTSALMQRLLEDALDPEDLRNRYHDVGGSG